MKRIVLVLMASMLAASSAFAQQGVALDQKWYVGPLLGISLGGGDAEVAFGADFGTRFNQFWGAGVYGTYVGSSAGAITTSQTVLAAEGNYFFDDALEGTRLGGKFGADFTSGTGLPSDTAITFGPHLAYDYGLGGGISVGAEANILFSTRTGQDAVTNLLAAFKFWF